MNSILLLLGVLTYMIYIWKENFRTVLHKGYVVIRFIISIARATLYFFSFFFYLTLVINSDSIFNLYYNIIYSFVLFYLEVNNIIWCFWLKSVIFYEFEENDSKLESMFSEHSELISEEFSM